MCTTRGYISQILSGFRHMTLCTLADICFALEKYPDISLNGAGADGWEFRAGGKFARGHSRIRYTETGNVLHTVDCWKTAV